MQKPKKKVFRGHQLNGSLAIGIRQIDIIDKGVIAFSMVSLKLKNDEKKVLIREKLEQVMFEIESLKKESDERFNSLLLEIELFKEETAEKINFIKKKTEKRFEKVKKETEKRLKELEGKLIVLEEKAWFLSQLLDSTTPDKRLN